MVYGKENISFLKLTVEEMYGKRFQVPKDFETLSMEIYEKTHSHVSPTTLKRLWGYLKNEQVTPSKTTLGILSIFVGYRNWNDFLENHDAVADQEEIWCRKITSEVVEAAELKSAQILKILWSASGYCRVKYIGDNIFEVLDCRKAFLKKGDTFKCWMLAEGEPLYATNLMRDGVNLGHFVLGKNQGVYLR